MLSVEGGGERGRYKRRLGLATKGLDESKTDRTGSAQSRRGAGSSRHGVRCRACAYTHIHKNWRAFEAEPSTAALM